MAMARLVHVFVIHWYRVLSVAAVKFNTLLPSALSTGIKTLSNFGLFFLIGHYYESSVFSSYIFLSILAAFSACVVDLGYATKIVVDFTNKRKNAALLDSFSARFVALFLSLLVILIVVLYTNLEWLFLFLFLNTVFTHWLESFSFSLRFERRYWSELLFTIFIHFVPFLTLFYFVGERAELKTLFLFYGAYKLLVFIPLYVRLRPTRVSAIQVLNEVRSCFKFLLDSVALNIQPLIQVYLAKIFLDAPAFIVFGYGQKIIQAFNTLFSALNNVFYPSLARLWGSVVDVRVLLKKFAIVANVIPLVCILIVFSGTYLKIQNLFPNIDRLYFEVFDILQLCLLLVFVRFNCAILGAVLTIAGLQKRRTQVNLIVLLTDAGLISAFLYVLPTTESIFYAMASSNFMVFISYIWVARREKNIPSLIFTWKKAKVQ